MRGSALLEERPWRGTSLDWRRPLDVKSFGSSGGDVPNLLEKLKTA
jgi:hypothetical protein